jgi:hypothetical protein
LSFSLFFLLVLLLLRGDRRGVVFTGKVPML